jgi:uncharacterized protein (UPF0335 family)
MKKEEFIGRKVNIPVVLYNYIEIKEVNEEYKEILRAERANGLSNQRAKQYIMRLEAMEPEKRAEQAANIDLYLYSLQQSEAYNEQQEPNIQTLIERIERAITQVKGISGDKRTIAQAVKVAEAGLSRIGIEYALLLSQRYTNKDCRRVLQQYAPAW